MISEGLMTPAGLEKVEAARGERLGTWDKPQQRPDLSFEIPAAFKEALSKNEKAQQTFSQLAPSYQKQYLGWIEMAKRQETKEKRIRESMVVRPTASRRILAEGKNLGLK